MLESARPKKYIPNSEIQPLFAVKRDNIQIFHEMFRWDMHKYAREAFDLGVRYIGGCCGFEPYHIR